MPAPAYPHPHRGIVVFRYGGTPVFIHRGIVVLWYSYIVVLWHCCILVCRYCGIPAPQYRLPYPYVFLPAPSYLHAFVSSNNTPSIPSYRQLFLHTGRVSHTRLHLQRNNLPGAPDAPFPAGGLLRHRFGRKGNSSLGTKCLAKTLPLSSSWNPVRKGEDAGLTPATFSPPPRRRRFCVRKEHFMFRTQQAVFSAARNVVCIRKPLARKGRGSRSEVAVSYEGYPCSRR